MGPNWDRLSIGTEVSNSLSYNVGNECNKGFECCWLHGGTIRHDSLRVVAVPVSPNRNRD